MDGENTLKVTFPHMETLWIALKNLFEGLGTEVVVPPPITKKTITLGARHSPEFACFPLKVNLGNFIEALEAGADTIIMVGGTGPCRLGYYAEVQREILNDLGYDFEMVTLEPPQGSLLGLASNIKRLAYNKPWNEIFQAFKLAWQQIHALDMLQKTSLKVRPLEKNKGDTTKAYERAVSLMVGARDAATTEMAFSHGLKIIQGVDQVASSRKPLKIGIVGEIYMVLEPYANMEIEKTLGEMGVEVHRSIYLGHWIKDHLLPKLFGSGDVEEIKKAALEYLDHFVGGHGLESVGQTILYARDNYDGVIHLLPFTCTPEIVAQSILPEVSRDYNIPLLSFSMDEHSGKAGIVTRLEAFLDLLEQKREKEKIKVQGAV